MNLKWILLGLLAISPLLQAQSDEERLTDLLNGFLDGASRNDIAAHERFWDDDLVYTSSAGERFGKARIIDEMRAAPAAEAESGPETRYGAEDIRIRVYGDTAVVAFRLLGRSEDSTAQYFNTGTFVRREDGWRAVAWQATRIPPATD
jgi:ketosteroid isomerase-like protein